jgi:hypothetical protein
MVGAIQHPVRSFLADGTSKFLEEIIVTAVATPLASDAILHLHILFEATLLSYLTAQLTPPCFTLAGWKRRGKAKLTRPKK